MKNEALQDIIEYATRKLNQSYGFCGVATGDSATMLNSNDNKGNDIIINIKLREE